MKLNFWQYLGLFLLIIAAYMIYKREPECAPQPTKPNPNPAATTMPAATSPATTTTAPAVK